MENTVIWSPGVSLDALEKMVIRKAILHYGGNKTATANALKIARRTLDNKLEQYEAEDKSHEHRQADESERRRLRIERARGFAPDQLAGKARQKTKRSVVEPPADATPEQAMPVPEQQDLSGMLPNEAAEVHRKRGRRGSE